MFTRGVQPRIRSYWPELLLPEELLPEEVLVSVEEELPELSRLLPVLLDPGLSAPPVAAPLPESPKYENTL